MNAERKNVAYLWLMAGFIICVCLAVVVSVRPPAAVPADAPADRFSSERAMAHLQVITAQSRTMGSSEHGRVRNYLIDYLTGLGLAPQVQSTTVIQDKYLRMRNGWPYRGGTVHNIAVRITGTERRDAILLMAHYDTKTTTPGAADDGVGVAAMLEVARALSKGEPLRNDVIFLFTDGEEVGLLGARAFLDEHPWARDVRLVLNLEGQGNQGPVFLFNTGDNNGWLIREFSRSVTHPFTVGSLGRAAARMTSFHTDYNEFLDKGIAGLDFASIRGNHVYHAMTDRPENIDERMLQHHGDNALALLRRLGNMDLGHSRERDAVYFNLIGSVLVVYPHGWAVPLAGLTALLYIAAMVTGRKKHLWIWKDWIRGVLSWLAAIAGIPLIFWCVWLMVGTFEPDFTIIQYGNPLKSVVLFFAFCFFALACALAWHARFRSNVSSYSFVLGAWIWWLLLAVATSVWLPDASYLFVWPLLFALAGWLAQRFVPGVTDGRKGWLRFIIAVLAAAPGLLLYTGTLYVLFMALNLRMIAASLVLAVLLSGLIVPLAEGIRPVPAGKGAVVLAAVGGLCLVPGLAIPAFDAETPRPDTLIYAYDADKSQAYWITPADRIYKRTGDDWGQSPGRGAMPEFFPLRPKQEWLKREAFSAQIEVPDVQVLRQTETDNMCRVEIRIVTPPKTNAVGIYVYGGEHLHAVSVGGKIVFDRIGLLGSSAKGAKAGPNMASGPELSEEGFWGLHYWAPPAEGLDMTLITDSPVTIKLRVVAQINGFPDIAEGIRPKQQAGFMPKPSMMLPPFDEFMDSEMSLVTKTIEW